MDQRNEATLTNGATYVHGETALLGNAIPKAKMSELIAAKEELKKAKETAMESWLDSMPLIDQLENAQAELAVSKTRSSMSSTIMEELQSQIESSIFELKLKKEEELETTKIINELTLAIDGTRQEIDGVKVDIGELRRSRSKLKQVLRLRRQTLRALQLAIRAARIEAEALEESTKEAQKQIDGAQMEGSPLEMTQEEYALLKRKAQEEKTLAEWRVAVSEEQRLAADEGRKVALVKFEGGRYVRRTQMIDEKLGRKEVIRKMAVDDVDRHRRSRKAIEEEGHVMPPRDRVGALGEFEYRRRYSEGMVSRRMGDGRRRKKKVSIFGRIKSFLMKSMARLFG